MRLLILSVISLIAINSAALADPAKVDVKELAGVARVTAANLAKTAASWEVRNALAGGTVIHVSMLREGEKQRMTVAFENGGVSTPVLRVISRDGIWYATDRFGSCKYRPYEVPTDTPYIYIALGRSEPRFVDAAGLAGVTFENVDGQVATYRGQLDPIAAKQLQATVDQMESLQKASGKPLPAETLTQIGAIKDLLAHGVPVRVDLKTGMTVEYGTQKIRTTLSDFHFLAKADDAEFAIDDQTWRDCSDDPTAGDLNDLMMIGHSPMVKVGDKNYDLDGRLMDVKTGRFRRIPFPAGLVMPGCFLKNRRSILVTGSEADTGSLRPYEIDLKTQECKALGGQLLASGFTLFGDLSPDGSTLVVLHSDPARNELLKSQICLIDVASGVARFVGAPLDAAFVNWAADGRHLILVRREQKDLNSPTLDTIASMDMQGHLNKIRDGDDPVVLADRRTILYQDNDTGQWHTCDLLGGNDKLFGDGLVKYGFPTPAPDCKRILMMHFAPNALPEPTVIKLGESQGRVITNVAGLWGQAAWR